MSEDTNSPKGKGFLKRSFRAALGVAKELTIHSVIHFTLWGAIFASNFAAFLTPVLDPIGQVVTGLAEGVGLGDLFTKAAGGGGASLLPNNPGLSSLPVLGQ